MAKQIRSTREASASEVAAEAAAARQAKARSKEASIQASLAESEFQRYQQLPDTLPPIEIERVKAAAQERKASLEAMSYDIRRLQNEQQNRRQAGEARLAELRRNLAALAGEKQAILAEIEELQQVIERHQIRAPADGYLGELQPIHLGQYISEGAKLATLLPVGELILVAEFEPASALGRVRPGQNAELRLSGFPWLEYGSVKAHVTQVASEVRDGTVRVELDLEQAQKSLIPFQHGLPGTVQVAVEHVTPAELVLRSMGRRLEGTRP
jgi:membrane fusion protein (multidrug efflux system)